MWGLALQFGFAFLVLKTDFGKLFQAASHCGERAAGLRRSRQPVPLRVRWARRAGPFGVIFAFQVLPIVIFIASLFAILYHIGVMQVVVRAMAVVMQKVMGASGAESTNVAASIFMGQTEAPLTIRPFLAGLTQSELFTIMTSGMAHVSGAVMAAYVKIAHVEIKHLLTAVIMTAPATIMLAKIMMPGDGEARDRRQRQGRSGEAGRQHHRCGGARRGRRPASRAQYRRYADRVYRADRDGQRHARVAARAAGYGLAARLDAGDLRRDLRARRVAAGRRWNDCATVGNLLGTRLVLNEFVAFLELGPDARTQLDPRSFVIATYALVRIRELQFDRDSDRRHRSAGSHAQIGPGAAGPAGSGRGNDGEFHVGVHRRNAVCSMYSTRRRNTLRSSMPGAPDDRQWCSAADWARSRMS